MHFEQNLSNKVTVTQQFRQSLKILQMPGVELAQFIQQQAVENPVIDIEESFDSMPDDEKLKRKLDWLDSTGHVSRIDYRSEADERDDDVPLLANTGYEHGQDVYSFLIDQLDVLKLSKQEYNTARFVILSLDRNGYLRENIENIAKDINVDKAALESALKTVQQMEPAGIGARDLKECLYLQALRRADEYPELPRLVDEYLEELSKGKFNLVSGNTGMSQARIRELYDVVRTFNPKPAGLFENEVQTGYIIPDVITIRFKDHFEMILNSYHIPEIKISSYYRKLLRKGTDEQTGQYIENKIRQANWLVKCIDQRNETLLSVARAIVEKQKEFFLKGPAFLTGMSLGDISDMLGLHQSTISRAVNGKYILTPWGTYAIKDLFISFMSGNDNEGAVPSHIKQLIKEIIQGEDKNSPLSDEKISATLADRGIGISRRTVAKYRDELSIPGSSVRRSSKHNSI